MDSRACLCSDVAMTNRIMRYVAAGIAGVALTLTISPAEAQLPNPLANPTDPADRAVMEEVAAMTAVRQPSIERLDALLAKLPRPTPLRGVVQVLRAGVLARQNDPGASVTAIEEALRLLPDDPRPKLLAAHIFTFSGSPARAADLWLQASRESPDLARNSHSYSMSALIDRLRETGDRARADRLAARLGEIGFSRALASDRSTSALARTREAMRAADTAGAATSLTAIGSPDDLASLYLDRRYAALWPRIAEWAGADLSQASLRYLEELRGDFTAAGDYATAVPYARALAKRGAYGAVVALFQPMFDRVKPRQNEDDQLFLAPIVARALNNLGRVEEARALLAQVAATTPERDFGNALNIDGAYLTLAQERKDWPQTIERADAFVVKAKAFGDGINRAATVTVQAIRACALDRSGRRDEARHAAATVLASAAQMPEPAMNLHLCRGDTEAARALLIARLADETTRDWALRFVQPSDGVEKTPLAVEEAAVAASVRTASDVIEAANGVGRILPQPLAHGVPQGFDPFRAGPRRTPLGPDAI